MPNLEQGGNKQQKMAYTSSQDFIELDSSVKSITMTAAMCISGVIHNGLYLSQNYNPHIKIYKDKIEFGKCLNPSYNGITGNIDPYFPNFYIEFGNLVYYFNNAYKCSFFTKQLDYVGLMAPTVPDNVDIFNQIYPRFA